MKVEKRDAATLIPIIEEYIQPGSIIYSDQWKACIVHLVLQVLLLPMVHVFNYFRNFVYPSRGVHTQQIKSKRSDEQPAIYDIPSGIYDIAEKKLEDFMTLLFQIYLVILKNSTLFCNPFRAFLLYSHLTYCTYYTIIICIWSFCSFAQLVIAIVHIVKPTRKPGWLSFLSISIRVRAP